MDPGAELFAQLMGAAVMGGITAGVAVHKGRSAVGWFFIGFLTGGIGLVVCLCMSNQKEQNEVLGHMEKETSKLREQLKYERLRNESFQHHVRTRIDAHDDALGVNTRAIGPGRPQAKPILPSTSLGANPVNRAALPSPSSFETSEWFVKFGSRSSQSLPFEKLKKFWEIGNLTPETFVCTSECEWVPVQSVPGLLEELNKGQSVSV